MFRSLAAACGLAVVFSCIATSTSAFAAEKPLSIAKAKAAATKQANAKGRERYPFDTFSVKVSACKRDSRQKVSCKSSLRGVTGCLATECAPRGPGLYRETCTWKSVVRVVGRGGKRQVRVAAFSFKCELGARLPDA